MNIEEISQFTQEPTPELVTEFTEKVLSMTLDEYKELVDCVDKLERNDERFLNISAIHAKAVKKNDEYKKKYNTLVETINNPN